MKKSALLLTLVLLLGLCAAPAAAREPSLFDALPQQEELPPQPGEGFHPGGPVQAVPPLLELTVDVPARTAQTRAALAENSDTVGWLTVPGTAIDTVVLQASDNQYYLRRDAQGNTSTDGSLFADYRCDVGGRGRSRLSNNTVIYGNSFSAGNDGAMFTQLNRFRDYGYAFLNPYLFFSTTEEDMVWEIFAVSVTDVSVPYNMPYDDLDAWWQAVSAVRGASLYEYNVALAPDDKVLTLSTVDYSLSGEYPNDNRLVIMARLVEEGAKLHPTAYIVDAPAITVQTAGGEAAADSLLGTWSIVDSTMDDVVLTRDELLALGVDIRLEFRDGGVLIIHSLGWSEAGSYRVDGQRIYIEESEVDYVLARDGDVLRLEMDLGSIMDSVDWVVVMRFMK